MSAQEPAAPREMTPGERRELRALVKKQFAILRNDVKRRQEELAAEVEAELLRLYRAQDERVEQARQEMARAARDYQLACEAIVRSLRELEPNLKAQAGHNGHLHTEDHNRHQTRRALLAAIPRQVADAQTRLDQQELDLLRELTISALDSEQARNFLGRIPTVGELVPRARLQELQP